jgi:peptidoglycan/xylan/chitin deacetylase (PgdA/CDA1 family)
MEIGSHTVSHPILSTICIEESRKEIEASRSRLQAITGQTVDLFAYPNGRPGQDFTMDHAELLSTLGFVGAVTTGKGVATRDTSPLLLPRFTPWDRTPQRFSLRLLQNALQSRNAA